MYAFASSIDVMPFFNAEHIYAYSQPFLRIAHCFFLPAILHDLFEEKYLVSSLILLVDDGRSASNELDISRIVLEKRKEEKRSKG